MYLSLPCFMMQTAQRKPKDFMKFIPYPRQYVSARIEIDFFECELNPHSHCCHLII